MAEDILLVSDAGAVRTLTLNRPDKLNALNMALIRALTDALKAADDDPAVGAVVLGGAGRAFCAGADLAEAQKLAPADGEAVSNRADLAAGLQLAIPRMRKTVIAAVKGYAMAGGCGLALACDLVVAAEDARFGFPEVKRGIVAAVVMATLARQVGPKPAFELAIRGEQIGAQRAYALGMVNALVPADRVLEEAQTIAASIAALSPEATIATKQLFQRVLDLPFEQALAAGRDVNALMRAFRKDPSLARFAGR